MKNSKWKVIPRCGGTLLCGWKSLETTPNASQGMRNPKEGMSTEKNVGDVEPVASAAAWSFSNLWSKVAFIPPGLHAGRSAESRVEIAWPLEKEPVNCVAFLPKNYKPGFEGELPIMTDRKTLILAAFMVLFAGVSALGQSTTATLSGVIRLVRVAFALNAFKLPLGLQLADTTV